jgi:diguanylate cyclase (GGDEF)-like protein
MRKLKRNTKIYLSVKSLCKTSYGLARAIVRHPVFVTSLFVASSVVGVRQLGLLQSGELLAFDQMVRMRPQRAPDPRLLVVCITEADIRAQNQWPFSDAVIARLLEQLQRHQPRTIGLDIYRDVPYPPGNLALLRQLQAPNVITIKLLGNDDAESVLPPPGVPRGQVGVSDIVLDPDAVVRRNFLYATAEGEEFYSFSLRLSLHYLAPKRASFKVLSSHGLQIGDAVFPALNEEAGGYEGMDDRGYQVLLDYASGVNVARQVTLTDVLQGNIPAEWVHDKVVLIGTTAPSVKDLFITPYNFSSHTNPEMPGVMVHAQKVSQILGAVLDGRSLVWYWSPLEEILWILLWALAGCGLGWRLRHPIGLGFVVLLGVGGLFGSCLLLFFHAGWVPFVPAAISFIGSSVAIIAYRLLHEALHDRLTNLPNRNLFINQVQWAMNRHQRFNRLTQKEASLAVLFLGIDSFKTINDSFGHRFADDLLIAISQRLQTCLRSEASLARVGGDEFAILLNNVRTVDEVAHLAKRLQTQVRKPFHLNGQELFTSASVGIAFNPKQGHEQPEDILRDAHTAMTQAKASGKAKYQVFQTEMRDELMTRIRLETDLRRAIARQEFEVHYQPFVCLRTGRIAGFEALLRWRHPQRGMVYPVEFIPIAEATDLILPIGQWVLREACQQLRSWHDAFPHYPPLLVSVNLSSKQFTQTDLVEQIQRSLQDTGLDGQNLKLEITESIAMTEVEATISLLLRLKDLHLKLSIDDFGTGYSSLSYLHRFPTDTIKVDRSFVSRMGEQREDAHIVQTIVMLGHNLGMSIIAEGVETAEQLARLRSLNCEYGQGFFFSKPLPKYEAEKLLKSNPQW